MMCFDPVYPQNNLDFNVGFASPLSTSLVLAAIHLYLSAAMTLSLKHSTTSSAVASSSLFVD